VGDTVIAVVLAVGSLALIAGLVVGFRIGAEVEAAAWRRSAEEPDETDEAGA
jgi:F0F1-type ATP synthase membrane subunit c/vacuolar-type H+-ATPase subunit K